MFRQASLNSAEVIIVTFVKVLLSPYFEPTAFDANSLLLLHLFDVLRMLGVDLKAIESLLLYATC